MSKITESARGQECQVRLPGICNFDPTTTVFAHLGGAGMGRKYRVNGMEWGAYACSACHDEIDRRTRHMDINDVDRFTHHGLVRTQVILVQRGIIGCL